MSAVEEFRKDLHFDCESCWANSCGDHGPVPVKIVAKVLLSDHDHLIRRYEEARQNLAVVLGMSQDAEFVELVAELRWRLSPRPDPAPHFSLADDPLHPQELP